MKYKHKKYLNICMHVKQKANSLYISTLCATDIQHSVHEKVDFGRAKYSIYCVICKQRKNNLKNK